MVVEICMCVKGMSDIKCSVNYIQYSLVYVCPEYRMDFILTHRRDTCHWMRLTNLLSVKESKSIDVVFIMSLTERRNIGWSSSEEQLQYELQELVQNLQPFL